MWYKIDFTKFMVQMLPPVLRSYIVIAILKILAIPLQYIHNKFLSLRSSTDDALNITGNVQYLQKALNDNFFLYEDQIYIDTPEESSKRILYYESEGQSAVYVYEVSESKPLMIFDDGESTVKYNFTVHVPTFLCTSVNKDVDKYGGVNYQTILTILNQYKPAGRTYNIELYDYE